MPRIDWVRKHTFMVVFLIVALISGYLFAYTTWLMPLQKLADEQAEANAEVPTGALTPAIIEETNAAVSETAEGAELVLGPLATTHGLTVQAIDAAEGGVAAEAFEQTTEKVTFTAPSIAAVDAFLNAINQQDRYIQVNELAIQNEDGVRLDLVVTLFSAKQAMEKE